MTETAQGMTDADLVVGARRGDKTAFGQLVRRYETAAYATAAAHLANRHDAEDAVQDAFVGAYVALGRLREPAKFGAWLREIVRRRALEFVSRRRTVRFVSDDGQALASSAGNYFAGDLCEAISLLSPRQREAVLACYGKDTTYERAAEYLGVSPTTLKGRLQMARERLRAILGDEESALKGDLTMNTEKIEKNVAEAVAKIASREINERYPLNGAKSVVFFGGVGCEVEVCQTDGDAVVVTGTATSVGLTPEDAERSVNGIRLEPGFPDDAVVFTGNDRDKDGKIVVSSARVGNIPERFGIIRLRRRPLFPNATHYPEFALRDFGIVNALIAAVEATDGTQRISLYRTVVDAIGLPPDKITSEIRQGFTPNYIDDRIAFGEAGAANLVIAIPAGVAVTLIGWGIKRAEVRGLRGDILGIDIRRVSIEDVEGSVRLMGAWIERVRNLHGDFALTHYGLKGTNWSNRHARRVNEAKCVIEDVSGNVSLDVGRLDLEISGVEGAIDTRNRWGVTRCHVGTAGRRVRLESDSGEVFIYLNESIIGEVGFVVNTICGDIRYDALGDLSVGEANNPYAQTLATSRSELRYISDGRTDYASEIVVNTRDGDVTLEKSK